jgi:predicted TIM-barrel fold metal-dependent hydrolase
MSRKIIDVRSRAPVEEHMGDYLQDVDPSEKAEDENSTYPELYSKLYEKGDDLLMDMDEYVEFLDDNNIEKKVIVGAEDIEDQLNEYPDKFIPEATVDVVNNTITEAVESLEDKVKNRGYGMVQLNPYEDQLHSNDEKYYPVYEKADELDIPIWVHTCSNFLRTSSSEFGHPRFLQDVCIDFPDLNVIAGHGTWPWVNEGCALMWKLPNLYTDFSAMRGKYVANNHDWRPLMEYGPTILQDQVLYGTSFPLVDDETQINDVENMDISEDVKQKWFYDNAAEMLNL